MSRSGAGLVPATTTTNFYLLSEFWPVASGWFGSVGRGHEVGGGEVGGDERGRDSPFLTQVVGVFS